MSAQNQIVVASVLFMFIAMMIMGIFSSIILYTKSVDATYEKMTIYVDKTKENIEQTLALITNTAHAVAASNTIVTWIDNPQSLDTQGKDFYSSVNKLEEEIKHVLNYSSAWKADLISYISIFVDDQLISYTYAKPLSEKQIIAGSNEAYSKLNKVSGSEFLPPLEQGNYIYYALKLKYDFQSNKSLVILIATEANAFKRLYHGAIASKDTQTYLTDEDGMIYSSSDETRNGKLCDNAIMSSMTYDQISNLTLNNKKYVAIAKKVENSQLVFINLVPHNYIFNQAFDQFPLFINTALILSIIIAVIGTFLSKKVTAFIKDLTNAMKEVKNANYDVKMPSYKNDAVDGISHTFNAMTTEMKYLIQTTYESKIMLQEMEFKFLQQQINPHFLFNILLVIQIKAKMSSDETVYNMLTSLSGLLRASLHSNKNTYTTLEEELKYVDFYLYLQQQRFSEKLHYEINIDEHLKEIKVPRLTIEPIVENAVIHGVENHEDVVKIVVTVWEDDQDLYVEVNDDGSGFDTNELELQDIQVKDGNSREKIGLSNINTRLKRIYGEEYGLIIHSEKGKGTRVIIKIQKDKIA
ncbi:sensor histidine kinase [Vallitalea okinawensis]|uniref:sensor histidine kinase n=1 Tax=Vallitalea okinawensis TaxID=2078660 RepID=UPI000CFAE5AD|nr:sensor histidine kinase [Vallitalea okinawensis]